MKIPVLTKIDISEILKPTDFLYQERLVAKEFIQTKFSHRYPGQPDMPSQHPSLSKNPAADTIHADFLKRTLWSQEFLDRCQRNAMQRDIQRRIENRNREVELQEDSVGESFGKDAQTIAFEKQKYTAWINRLYMKKMFADLKTTSMDDFIKMSQENAKKMLADHDNAKFYFGSQYETSYNSKLMFSQINKVAYLTDLTEVKLAVSEKLEQTLSDMRHQVAEQNATIAFNISTIPAKKAV